jgi:hypothetical protein
VLCAPPTSLADGHDKPKHIKASFHFSCDEMLSCPHFHEASSLVQVKPLHDKLIGKAVDISRVALDLMHTQSRVIQQKAIDQDPTTGQTASTNIKRHQFKEQGGVLPLQQQAAKTTNV